MFLPQFWHNFRAVGPHLPTLQKNSPDLSLKAFESNPTSDSLNHTCTSVVGDVIRPL